MSNDELSTPKWDGSDKLSEDTELVELEQKAFKESIQDGLNIMTMGMILFVFAVGYSAPYISEVLPLHVGVWVNLLLLLLFIPIFLLVTGNRLKERFTYPRIGYVKPRNVEPRHQAAMILSIALGFIVIIAFTFLSFGPSFDNIEMAYRFMPLYFGLAMVIPSILFVRKTGNLIYSLLGILMGITGFAFVVTDFGEPRLGFVLYMLLWSSILTLVGLVLFVRFIKTYPVFELPEDDASE
ncbi:MAG: hypothetical protein P1Q69_05060 [Candidatus Thorarchaeota archaeon]|nr:hypothetical protein [Candidatus Thorarchaeota archaeon]